MEKKIINTTKFAPVKTTEYKDGIFQAGLIKNSPHPIDKIYLRIDNWFFHLRHDEIYAILSALNETLWCEALYQMHKKKFEMKWLTLKELKRLKNKG